jgi:transcriptional regulator with XRE-family HTH domain
MSDGTQVPDGADPKPSVSIGHRLREAREARGLTQVDVAARTGIRQATISKFEKGQIGEPGAQKIAALAQALDVSMEWIITGAGEGPRRADAELAPTGTEG